MKSDVLLKSHLKTLKLPTILQEHARAARQCAQEDRSFEDFLLYLVELEVAERHRKACENIRVCETCIDDGHPNALTLQTSSVVCSGIDE